MKDKKYILCYSFHHYSERTYVKEFDTKKELKEFIINCTGYTMKINAIYKGKKIGLII